MRSVTQHLLAWVRRHAPERSADILIRRLSLDGHPAPTFAELGAQYGFSRERARQLEVQALKRLSSRRGRAALEQVVATVAREILELPGTSLPSTPCRGSVDAAHLPTDEMALADGEERRALISTLFAAGLAPAAIARRLGCSEDLIFYHFSRLVERGEVAVEQILPSEVVATVRTALVEPLDQIALAAILRRVPATITSAQVRCVLAAGPGVLSLVDPAIIQEARVAARAVVADMPGVLSRSAVAKLLAGSTSKRVSSQREHPAFGVFAGSDVKLLTSLVDDLIVAGEIGFDEQGRLVYINAPTRQKDG